MTWASARPRDLEHARHAGIDGQFVAAAAGEILGLEAFGGSTQRKGQLDLLAVHGQVTRVISQILLTNPPQPGCEWRAAAFAWGISAQLAAGRGPN